MATSSKIYLVESIPEVFSMFITEESIIEEEIKQLQIDKKESKQEVMFPSPELSASLAKKKYAFTNSLKHAEEALDALSLLSGILDYPLYILPKMAIFVRKKYLESFMEKLFRRDPDRRWRYWINLFQCIKKIEHLLSSSCKEKILVHIVSLKKHWAYAVRKAAIEIEGIFIFK